MIRRVLAGLALAGIGALLLAGCAGTGPTSIARDRFDYVTSISDSWKRQMLLNLLKVRYSDAPVFMDIASVINSYELAGEVSLAGQIAKTGAGDKFTRSLMLPIPVPSILYLTQSGFPADLVLRRSAVARRPRVMLTWRSNTATSGSGSMTATAGRSRPSIS
jgi:hypothetical protein